MTRLWLTALLIVSGCTTQAQMCEGLRDALSSCGLPAEGLDCSRVDYTTLGSLAQRMDGAHCDVAAEDADAVDPRLCAVAGWSCPDSPTPKVTSAQTSYPIVLVGGIDDTPVFDWNPSVGAAIKAAGGRAYHVRVVPWQPTAARAADLWGSLSSLRRTTGADRFNLVCYAVAGLDCRYLVSAGGLFAKDEVQRAEVVATVASITTMATPHRGTRVADAAILALQSSTTVEVLQTLFGVSAPASVPDDATLTRTLHGLTVDALATFDRDVPDEPSIYAQSFAGVSALFGHRNDQDDAATAKLCVDADGQPFYQRHQDTVDALNPLLMVTAPFSHTARDRRGIVVSSPSDGMISLASAPWGRFRGCLPADHYDVIGQIGLRTRDPITGFDARDFYTWLAADLAQRGL